ncbi:unnamed protein product [Brachionus calyciflorus]|uniref:Uncharacterized protein n=1 Tax=Brachionus calyciflorus TaxID=104777 RepID=A0A814QZB3_9BILA|nr:unnamed protein product [Brachionus calyciflorus]
MFKISLWNVNDRVTKDLPKTNNYCESWHYSFTDILNTHPLIYELIDKLRNEQNRTEKNVIKIKTGQGKSKNLAKEDVQIQNILSNYDPKKK